MEKHRILLLFTALLFGVVSVYAQQTKRIAGVVKDSSGEAVIGANVRVKDATIGTITDIAGKFVLDVPENTVLQISYIGFAGQDIPVGNQSFFEITLKEDTRLLDEVVVVGYGTMRKKDLTGSVVQIKPDAMANEAPKTIQDIMRGTPGLKVGSDFSAKGGGSIEIRGQRSVGDISQGSPLIILDGMMFFGEFSEINPEDIGQIDVLKDASAAAVYGAKAANGVIIITTKKGEKGKPVVHFKANYGFVTKSAYREVFSPEGYMNYREDFYKSSTYGVNPDNGKYEEYQARDSKGNLIVTPGYSDRWDRLPAGVSIDDWRAGSTYSDREIYGRRLGLGSVVLENYINGKSFDWYDHAFQTGINQDYNISISGGSDNMNYYMSVGYLSNEGVARGNEYSAIRANMKLSGKVTNWLEISGNVNFQDRTDGDIAIDIGSTVANSPYADYLDSNGKPTLYPMGEDAVGTKGYNYDFDRQYKDLEKGYMVLNSIFTAKITLPFNITYSFNASPRYQYFYDRYFESSDHPLWSSLTHGVNREQAKRFDWSLNNTINWDYTFAKKHHVNLTLVQEAEERQYWSDRIEARNILPTDALGFHNTQNASKEASSFNSNDSYHSATGMLARLFYSYDDRYMLTASIRRDGYSAFGQNNPYATFPSLALGWTFTNEKFFNWEPMNYGKLRVSWGKNGNRSLSDPYISLANLRRGTNLQGYLISSSGTLDEMQYLIIDRLANPNLQWEKAVAYNVGLDFGFLDGRISGSLEGYVINTEDMILPKQLPIFSGFGSIATNLGKVQNRGFEFTINTKNMKTENFEWNTSFNLSYNKNEIKHLYYEKENILDDNGNIIGTKERDEYGKWFIGKPISTIWNYRVVGIWQPDELEEAAKVGQRPGDPKVANNYTADDIINADGSRTPVYNDHDKEHLGQSTSPLNWQMRNSFTIYKDFEFSFNIYSFWGRKTLETAYLNVDNGSNDITYGFNRSKKEYWTPDNLTNEYARLESKGPTGVSNPGKLYDRSFIRLDNISLAYNVPKSFLSKFNVQNAKVFGTIRNVAVWSKDKWEYGDIESGGLATRTYTMGLNVTF